MKKTLIIVFFFLLSTPACKVNADSCGYIVKFNSDTFIADNRFEKLFDNTYRISGMNYLYGLEDLIEYVEPDDEVELINPVETKQKNRQLSISKKTETINWQAEMIKAD
ncbi:MAG: hypothetical protein IJQ28_06780, partial [Clostridia bacterium]|nr:hypothetical protein [Clostridia bacterium]